MALSLTSDFNSTDIQTVSTLKAGAVYLLRGKGPDLVVKKEELNASEHSKHFQLSRDAMGVIDKNVKSSHQLSSREVSSLMSWVTLQKHQANAIVAGRLPGATTDLDDLSNALWGTSGGYQKVWYKMPPVQMMNLLSAWEARMGFADYADAIPQSNKPLRTFLKTLRASGGLEALGQVVAIDMFSGNTDRITPNTMTTRAFGTDKFKLKVIRNVGNLMIVEKGKARTISGMDFADPNSMLRHADKALSVQNQDFRGEWLGPYITDDAKRAKFAKAIVADLELIFNSGNGPSILIKNKGFFGGTSSDVTALGMNAPKRLEKGMLKGAQYLIRYIDSKSKKTAYPSSFTERATQYKALLTNHGMA